MKNIGIHFLVLFFLVLAMGCGDENDQLNPLSLKQEENCMESTVDILDFEFCILNSNNVRPVLLKWEIILFSVCT